MKIKELKELLEKYPEYSEVKINFGSVGDDCPDNSEILDVTDVGQSGATSIVYLRANYFKYH